LHDTPLIEMGEDLLRPTAKQLEEVIASFRG